MDETTIRVSKETVAKLREIQRLLGLSSIEAVNKDFVRKRRKWKEELRNESLDFVEFT